MSHLVTLRAMVLEPSDCRYEKFSGAGGSIPWGRGGFDPLDTFHWF